MPTQSSTARPRNRRPALLAKRFDDLWKAHLCVGACLIGWLLIYAGVHFLWPAPRPDWGDAVKVAEDGTFRAIFQDNKLERFFARNKINEFKKLMEDKAQPLRSLVLAPRRCVLNDAQFLSINGIGESVTRCTVGSTSSPVNDMDYLVESLQAVSNKLSAARTRFHTTKQPEVTRILTALGAQMQVEDSLRRQLRDEVTGLCPVLSFDWLYYEDWLWLIELFFLTVLGVLANTMIKLIRVGRVGEYNPDEFVMFFPKLVLAPFLSLVFVALWTSGFTESKIEFLNLPLLLVTFFLLGFATESLYDKIIGVAEVIITPLTRLSEEKLKDAAPGERYVARYSDPGGPPPVTVADLRRRAPMLVKAQCERGVVIRLAGQQKG